MMLFTLLIWWVSCTVSSLWYNILNRNITLYVETKNAAAGAASIIGGQESYGMGRGRGGGRGAYRGHAGEKRPRNLDRLITAPGEQGQNSVVDMSVEHEYSD